MARVSRLVVCEDTGRGWVLHKVNPATDKEWTTEEALRAQRDAEEDGADVIALLIVGDAGFFAQYNNLYVCPMFDGSPDVDEAVVVDEDHLAGTGLDLDWLAEMLNP